MPQKSAFTSASPRLGAFPPVIPPTRARASAPATPEPKSSKGKAKAKEEVDAPVRRSARVRKPVTSYAETRALDTEKVKAFVAESKTSTPTRRNPKRKAAPEIFDVPEHLLETSLGPWRENELSEWPSWVEVESDPVFINRILGLLGVKDAKIQEIFTLDDVAILPDPVYGLIFLFEYLEDDNVKASEASQNVWFANQTTNNACATVALFNIIMNAGDLALGAKLAKFKQESSDMSPPLRGNFLSNSSWIREAHNSFARRLDLLNAALALSNSVEDSKKKRRKTASSKSTSNRKYKWKTKPAADVAFHYIAFVPVGQSVWQIDGLAASPRYIGDFEPGQNWTEIARPVLESRMLAHETSGLNFNLLALCRDHNTASIRRDLAINIRCIEHLEAMWSKDPAWPQLDANDTPCLLTTSSSARLGNYLLEAADILTLSVASPELLDFQQKIMKPNFVIHDALELRQKTLEAQKDICERFDVLLEVGGDGGGNGARAIGGKKDHTPAIHEWVMRLADHGVLLQLHEEAQEI
ncbi:hypothetical protein B0T17DRAFT_500476 [Bombardia bombarda]|uniref:ubiquitinyl hydrolase 1 n=1 Tax=Bombardia bombarda TaxID=252184 RepID=A0AA39TKE1_9PEZI|nr:hypothetical protein B0T17DRAFT_500476 [Bombardia bombarda]